MSPIEMELEALSSGYWRSLDELYRSERRPDLPPDSLARTVWDTLSEPSRRQFLKALGASLALAGLAGCRWPREEILPFSSRPEGRAPGVPAHYATAFDLAGSATALLVTSHDGRPTKVEGNPRHPFNAGACDRFAQASLLELYDPDRSTAPVQRQAGQRVVQSRDGFAAFSLAHFARIRERRGAGLAILNEAYSSPTLHRLRQRLGAELPQARWFEYEAVSPDNEREGTLLALGNPYRTQLALAEARVIAAFDADLLLGHPAALKYGRDFAARRTGENGSMNRLYVLESAYSVTGAAADLRFATPASMIAPILLRLAAELVVNLELELPSTAGQLGGLLTEALSPPVDVPFLPRLARELRQARGEAVIAVGAAQPPEAHALACLLNEALGNTAKTVSYTRDLDPERPAHAAAIKAVTAALRDGQIDTLLILGGNPAYNAPADLSFPEALQQVKTTIHLSPYEDETSELCTWHLPRAHYLESWGDARAYDGTISIVQPLIEPLYGGQSPIELLSIILDRDPQSGYELVKRTFYDRLQGADLEVSWRRALHDGLLENSAFPAERPAPRWHATAGIVRTLLADLPPESDSLEIVFCQDHSTHDGRFAQNPWLQELPDPLTKLTWDNAAIIGPATALALGVETATLLRLSYRGRQLEIPAYVMPGQAENSVLLPLGYGRRKPDNRGSGFDAYALRTADAPGFDRGLSVLSLGTKYPLACTQEHYPIDRVGQEGEASRLGLLAREGTLDEYRREPEFARHRLHEPPLRSLWQEHRFEGRRWAMAIDLSACIGCNACVVACQAENNIPVVGKENVALGREMHWIRVDRYFSGPPSTPGVSFQPVACQQCEHAPCEEVCPVAATQHSEEGLNEMVYNRCVGTRYCSNNCPYKVRRFNFFNYHKELAEVEKMAHNPEVTVRSRGVMEKCTYCIQRINRVKIAAGNERRPIGDGEIVPACAQTCPTRAIVFGDLADPQSRVSKLHDSARAYAMLGELNVRPRTHYLARLRNPPAREEKA